MALSDLLSGRQVGEIVDDLIELWEMCLRVLDDIKVVPPTTQRLPILVLSLHSFHHNYKIIFTTLSTGQAPFKRNSKHSFSFCLQESVRKAAATACKALHKLTVRACDGTTMSKTGTVM